MSLKQWEKRLCNLIKKYKPSSDVASFRNDFRDAVFRASTENAITKEDATLLQQARDYLESWAGSSPPDPPVAYSQWETLYEAGKGRFSHALFEALFRRFPAVSPGLVNWEPFLLRCRDAQLIHILLDRRLIREQELNRLAEVKPGEFYQSVALDALVERAAFQCHASLWDECARGNARPPGLLSREELLVCCYTVSPEEDGNERLLSLLINRPQDQERVLELLLGEPEAARRFCRYLVAGMTAPRGGAEPGVADRPQAVLPKWIARCTVEVEKAGGARAVTASTILAMIRLCLLTATPGEGMAKAVELAGAAARATEKAVLHTLQQSEADRSSGSGDAVLVMRGEELYRALQEYLRRLPIGTRTGQESPERALRHEHYLGSKEVLEQLLPALEESLDADALRDALEVALFNCGVRPLGDIGAQLPFDARIHQSDAPGVLPGDPVVIKGAGRYLGEGEEGLVLTKAKVDPISDPSSS